MCLRDNTPCNYKVLSSAVVKGSPEALNNSMVLKGCYLLSASALNRATVAEQALLSSEKATFEAERDTVIADALTAGKITPASKEYHLAQCRDQASLDEFKKFAGVRPVIAPKSGLDDKTPPDGTPALNREEQKLCTSLGLSEEDYKKSLKEVA
ncbi:MAG: hypothetical protein GY862_17340 [Gammaproteobacteria bacterium]|nr:hypothetical protein [Gammaproteobacteria bacterium]